MIQCPMCSNTKLQKAGFANGKQRHRCTQCKHRFTVKESQSTKFAFDKTFPKGKYVITSAQNNTEVNQEFLDSLLNFCEINEAKLVVLPIFVDARMYPGDMLKFDIDESFLVRDKFSIGGKINVLSNININPTADNPVGGLETLSKGNSLIIPHPQVQLKSLPVSRDSDPIIITTTGSITTPNYKGGKTGQKAEFNHSYSAVFVDFDSENDLYHIRHLNADDEGCFYDISGYYDQVSVSEFDHVEALITGDEHIYVKSEEAHDATYLAEDSMLNILKPLRIIRHDILDCFTVSHHHRKDNFLQYSKFSNGMNVITDELNKTIQYIQDTTPAYATTYIVSSNHHDHLKRWLTEADPKIEPWNAKVFHLLTYLMMEEIDKVNSIYTPDPFELYYNKTCGKKNVKFLDRNKSFKLFDIELSNHGDVGANGSRGSLGQFSKFSDKQIIGHSHTPGINKGAMQVGCLVPKELEYTNGASSWMHSNVVIYPNGKRQLINIIRGKWY